MSRTRLLQPEGRVGGGRAPGARGLALALAAVVAAGLAARAPLLTVGSGSYRLTESYNIEETENLRLSTGMLHKRTLNPHAFEYPSLFYELSLAVEAPLAALGRGSWTNYLIGVRALGLALGLATIALAGVLAARIGGPWAGLVAASLVAFDRTLLGQSPIAKPNSTQWALLLAGFVALLELARRPRLPGALLAAALFGLATAAEWLGGLGFIGVAVAPALALPVAAQAGWQRLVAAARAALRVQLPVTRIALPLVAFGVAFLIAVPYALLSPHEFGFGFGQVFLAQSAHRRALPPGVSLFYLAHSMGPVGIALAAGGFLWALARIRRYDGSPEANGMVLVLAWVVGYGALVLFAFARLAGYVDLWVPFLAVLAGCAFAGRERFGVLGHRALPGLVLALVLAGGVAANGASGLSLAAQAPHDTRLLAGGWLGEHAAPDDTVLADLYSYVPDRFRQVRWNIWGGPPRTVYDETATWGRDPKWPEWYGGHRRLLFVNAKWSAPESLLAARPRWVVTSEEWVADRAHPPAVGQPASPDYDRSLADGRAGYVERARFRAPSARGGDWAALARARRAAPGEALIGPEIVVYERSAARALEAHGERGP